MWSVWLVFCDCGFHSVCPVRDEDKRFTEASWWETLTVGEIRSCLMGGAMLSKSLIQFSFEGWGCVPSLLFYLRPNYGRGNEDNGDLHQKVPFMHCHTQSSWPCSRPLLTHASTRGKLLDTHREVWVSFFWGHCSFLLGPGMHNVLFVPPRVCFASPV